MQHNMNARKLASLALALVAGPSFAQQIWSDCIDPTNTSARSVPFTTIGVGNDFVNVEMGTGGTVTYGGQTGPCYAPGAQTMENKGRFAMWNGAVGSVQSSFDDGMLLTVGAPLDPVGDYFFTRIFDYPTGQPPADPSYPFIGDAVQGWLVGASRTYFRVVGGNESNRVELTVRILGDAARWEWNLTNVTDASRQVGLRYGVALGMVSQEYDSQGRNLAFSALRPRNTGLSQVYVPKPAGVRQADGTTWNGYVVTGTTKPLRVERNFLSTRSSFPETVKFMFGQLEAYGLRVDNVPAVDTPDATRAAQLIVGNHGQFQSPGLLRGDVIRSRVFGDFNGGGDPLLNPGAPITEISDTLLQDTSFAQSYAPTTVAPGGSRKIVYYMRSPWSVGDYRDPYTSLIDAPRIIASSSTGGLNGLNPNPFRVVAYVDNQYATVDREVPMNNVRISLLLEDGKGLKLQDGEPVQKTLATILPRDIGNVQWNVEADGKAFGKVPYKVRIEPEVGPTRELSGTILVAATPTVRLGQGPNLVTLPWTFSDTALDSILGLKYGQDYVAYKWQGDIGEYIPVSSASRGASVWVVPTSDLGNLTLKGASAPSDSESGGAVTILRPGWNMIGNPYQYPIVLSTLTAVAEDDPSNSLTWTELVESQIVSSSLAYWVRNPEDPSSGTYAYTEGATDRILPSIGYWVFVSSFNPVKLIWPPIFDEGLPGATRSKSATTARWQQSDKQWRLQLSARNGVGQDAYNYVGVAASTKDATRLKMQKPPMSPDGKVELSLVDPTSVQPTRLSQVMADNLNRREYKVLVTSKEAGEVTVSWPNLSTVPRNVRFQLVDKATSTSRDLRFAASYTFRMEQPGTRELTLQMEPGVQGRAVIGDVIVTRPSRDARAPFTINYSLSTQALTTIRILGGSGKEVFTVTRGRSDRVGENSATWAMRDNANRAVAPGAYQVEILAETTTGERVRKIVPVNVVR